MSKQHTQLAAIDLGSNSFHMIIGRLENGQVKVIDKLREMVRLASGLTDKNDLTDEARERALNCLRIFGQRLKDFPPNTVFAVGTNTLRKAKQAGDFLDLAEEALGHPIEIISGVEEARLVFLGVANSLGSNTEDKRLVVDIGGGSTELIVGQAFNHEWLESLYMGCVSYSQRFFKEGILNERNMTRAEIYAQIELEPVKSIIKQKGWQQAIGTSGTIRAIQSVITAMDSKSHYITLEKMLEIRQQVIAAEHIDNLSLKGLKPERAPVFAGGLAILISTFEALGIEQLTVSPGALREGLLYDEVGRTQQVDVRQKAVRNFMKRYQVDQLQADRVLKTALMLQAKFEDNNDLFNSEIQLLMQFAIQLHEVGLAISHSQYHKHGAYLTQHTDIAGFTLQEQLVVARLVRAHRRKIPNAIFKELPRRYRTPAKKACIIIRLAVLFNRSRSNTELPPINITTNKQQITLQFPEGWLEAHPLTQTDLSIENDYWASLNYELLIE
jgi:exopolyphosphatase / guanosine-5'-triphosphate,3'-diphosphate pyrophosphatase